MLQDLVTTCIQNLGRFMRFTPSEENKGVEARRVVFIMNPKETQEGLLPMLLALVKENFEKVGVVRLGELEEKLFNVHRKRGRQAQIAMKAELKADKGKAKLEADKEKEKVAELPGGDMDNHADNDREKEMYEILNVDKFRREVVQIAVKLIKGNEIDPREE